MRRDRWMTMYRLLLLAFPRKARREFGEDMAKMFAAQLDEARARGASLTRLWIRAVADALWHGLAERATLAAAHIRELWIGIRRWRWWMHALRQDLSYALRLMVRAPGAIAIALLTLAIGIGANAAIFSAVDALLLRPLPYDDPDRLVMIWEKRIAEGGVHNVVAPADYLDWSRMTTSFEAMAAFSPATADLTGLGEPTRLFAASVSPAFFDVLRVRMALGRTFRPDEATVGRHRVVILGHGFWQGRFGGDSAAVGKQIVLNGNVHEIVGVLPQTFEYPDPTTIDIWAPLALEGGTQPPARSNHFLSVYARLKEATTLEQARAEMDRLSAQISELYPESNRTHRAAVMPLRDELVGPVRTSLLLLLAAVGFVLLIACVNVANLLLARAAARRRELAVRAALGASRARLAGQALTESLLLAFLGGLAGLLVAKWGVAILHQIAPRNVPILGLQRIGIDARVLLYSFSLSLVTGVVFGLLPAWHFASQNLNDGLKEGGRSQGGLRRRLRATLVVSEIALASLLLVGAGLSLRSFQTVLRTDAGISTSGLLTAVIALPSARYRGDDKYAATFQSIEDRFRSIPGIASVGATVTLPLSGQDGRRSLEIEGVPSTAEAPTRAHARAVTVDYFRTMNMRLVSGRAFSVADRKDAPPVVVVNETMARRYWPDTSPLGRRVKLPDSEWREIVGVVRDVRHWGLERPVNPEMYCPLPQLPFAFMNFVLATQGDPASYAGAVREALREIDPDLPLSRVRTMDDVLAASMASRRAALSVLGTFGIVALILAAAGIYGVMSHLVSLRTSEIGVRMTIGARRGDIMRLILAEGLLQAGAGLTIGLAAAVLLMRSFRTLLYEVSPADPVTLAAVAAILLATALAACLVPARRAMNVDPVTALRQ